MLSNLIIFLTFFITSGLVYVLVEQSHQQRRQVRARLERITGSFRAAQLSSQSETLPTERPDALPTVSRWLGRGEWDRRLRQTMIRSDLRLRPAEWVALCAAISVCFALFGLLATHEIGMAMLMAVLGAALPLLWLMQRQAARRRRFAMQLPDALMLLTASLRAGHSFTQAMHLAASELPAPLADEFAWAVGEIALGVSTEIALGRMVARVRSPDLDLIVTAILIQLPVGGNLAALFDAIADTLRERVRMQGEIETLTAEGKLSGIVLIALPLVLALLLHFRSPDYFQPLLENQVGRKMIAGAIAGQIVGGLIIRRLVTLDI